MTRFKLPNNEDNNMEKTDILYKIGYVIMDIASFFSPNITRMNGNMDKWID